MQLLPSTTRNLQYSLASRIVVCALFLGTMACKEQQPNLSSPVNHLPIPKGDGPLVVLASRSLNHLPEPYFVLYTDGRVIFGAADFRGPVYRTAQLTPEEVANIYSQVLPSAFDIWDGSIFTPGGSSLPTYYLFIRRVDGTFISLAAYSLLLEAASAENWPTDTQPPPTVKQALKTLAKYDNEEASPWMPPEIEVIFQSAVPEPEQKAWWPKTWPQPPSEPGISTIRLGAAYAKELNRHLQGAGIVKFGRAAYAVNPRYPFSYEEMIVAPMNILAKKSGVPF